MAIQYSGGTNINSTFTCTTGSRQEIVTGLENALVAAGWTVISGSGTSNVLLESATTPSPQNLVCRVNVQDTGSGNCAQIKFRNQGNTKAQSGIMYLLPTLGKVYRVIANKYQFFCFSSDSVSTGRTYVAGGVPYLSSFLQGVVTECIWGQSNCTNSDSSTTLYPSFRTHMFTGFSSAQCNQWNDVNGNAWEVNGVAGAGPHPGAQQLMLQIGPLISESYQPPAYRWHDGSHLTYEPLLIWGLTSLTDEPLIRGQLWDCAIISGKFVADQTTAFDAYNWWVITHNCFTDTTNSKGATLLHVVP